MNRRRTGFLSVSISCLVLLSTRVQTPLRAQDAGRIVEILDAGETNAREEAPEESTASSDDSGATEKEEAPSPLFYFRDNSKVAGRPEIEILEVRTSYGLLKVPVAELVRVRFARRVSPEVEETIVRSIEQLGDEDFETRQKAAAALSDIGAAALPALRKAVKSTDEEVKQKAAELLSEIYAEQNDDAGNGDGDALPPLPGVDDEVISTRMTIKGRIVQEQFSIDSRYGRLEVATGMLSGIVFRVVGPSSRKVNVAATFQPPGNWFDSKLEVERGQRFRINASGIVSVSNYGVSCGPDGTTRYTSSRAYQGFPVLSLVGKIGKRGKAFLIGSDHKGKAGTSGKLYLAITPFYYNPGGAVGNYQVKIDVASGR